MPVARTNPFMSEANATELPSTSNAPVLPEKSESDAAIAQESAQALAQDAALAAILASNKVVLDPYLKRSVTLLSQPHRTGYTLQLASLSREENAQKYFNLLADHVDMTGVFAQLSSYNGRKFVSVYFGQYPSADLAKQALSTLPEPVKTSKPIVRTWAKIKQDQAP
jgi:septal ring-binding cell division protein DamX